MNDLFFAYGLIVIALLLMAAELFFPTTGILFVVGAASLGIGVIMAFAINPLQGLIVGAFVCIVLPLLGSYAKSVWPNTRWGRKFFLPGADEANNSLADTEHNLELESLKGRYGRTLSPLRPAGITQFDGKRVDTLSDGPLVEEGAWVRCIEVRAGKVVVRRVDAPPDFLKFDTHRLDF